MNYEDIFEYVDAVPFRPFEIRMASGRTFEIRHPENIRVGEHSVHVFMFADQNKRIYDRAMILGYNMMESLERVDDAIAQD